jgi:lipopolysaccharide transport system permease protein
MVTPNPTMLLHPAPRNIGLSPSYVIGSLRNHKAIVLQIARRDMIERYRGSIFGLLWSLFNPILMLLVYTFVFSVVFRVKWPGSDGGSLEFGVNSFVGMIVFSLFSESLSRAPSLVLQNANLVKKVVFPLEVLPWVTLASSLFHVLVNYIVLLVFVLFIKGSLSPTVLLFPLVIVPVALLALGLSWFLSSIGVFFRDMSHTVALLVSVWMFVSPIFYPLSAVPPGMRRFLELNPLAPLIDDARSVALLGVIPDLSGYLWTCAISAAVAWAGLWWFMRTKHTFADVL